MSVQRYLMWKSGTENRCTNMTCPRWSLLLSLQASLSSPIINSEWDFTQSAGNLHSPKLHSTGDPPIQRRQWNRKWSLQPAENKGPQKNSPGAFLSGPAKSAPDTPLPVWPCNPCVGVAQIAPSVWRPTCAAQPYHYWRKNHQERSWQESVPTDAAAPRPSARAYPRFSEQNLMNLQCTPISPPW